MILYRRYTDRVYQKCLAYSGNEADARDLTQEVFIKLYTGFRSFRFQSSVSTWVHRIAANHCLNFLRARRHFASFDETDVEASQSGQNEMDEKLDLRDSLRRLPVATRSLLLLKYIESYTYEEISELTGLSVSAVKMRISRARQSLARGMTQ
jgi:RNA polymerase sigma-70 factor (ECF subfamily)